MFHLDSPIAAAIPLVASLSILIAAPLLHRAVRWSPAAMRCLGLGIAAATFVLVAVEILPECTAAIGPWAVAAAAAGLFGSVIVERRMATAHGLGVGLVAAALAIHAVTDGLAMAGAAHHHGHTMGCAVVMHRLPVALTLWWLLHPRGRFVAATALALVGVGTLVGYGLGEIVAPLVDATIVWTFQAFISGVLLHVVLHSRGRR